jgi:FkbM family methyltransferase
MASEGPSLDEAAFHDDPPTAALGETPLPNGLRVVGVNAYETRLWFAEIFEQHCYRKHGVVVPKHGAIVDCGANIGMTTLYFHYERPGIEIVSIEPAPGPFSALAENIHAHRVNAHLLNLCVGARRGRAVLTYYPRATGISSVHGDPVRDSGLARAALKHDRGASAGDAAFTNQLAQHVSCEREVRTLSEIIAACGIERIGLLKIDVEHAELEALLGICPKDWGRIDQVVIEVHGGDACLECCLRVLESRGFATVIDRDEHDDAHVLYLLYAKRT